jgi:hypothetical protein
MLLVWNSYSLFSFFHSKAKSTAVLMFFYYMAEVRCYKSYLISFCGGDFLAEEFVIPQLHLKVPLYGK